MKIEYNLENMIKALDYYDLQGLVKIIFNLHPDLYYAVSNEQVELSNFELLDNKIEKLLTGRGAYEMENLYRILFNSSELTLEERRTIERLMISCARNNSIGF